jgi:hypothetical protein
VTVTDVLVFDDVLPDAAAYRDFALSRPFRTVSFGPAHFHGIGAVGADDPLSAWARTTLGATGPLMTFLRQSPAGQEEPNYIHTDLDMGDWTAILYLSATPPPGDGTTFWCDRETGAVACTTGATSDANLAEVLAWRDLTRWLPWTTVEAKFNRVVVFPGAFYHSRALFENYGAGDAARLIQVMFGRSGETE